MTVRFGPMLRALQPILPQQALQYPLVRTARYTRISSILQWYPLVRWEVDFGGWESCLGGSPRGSCRCLHELPGVAVSQEGMVSVPDPPNQRGYMYAAAALRVRATQRTWLRRYRAISSGANAVFPRSYHRACRARARCGCTFHLSGFSRAKPNAQPKAAGPIPHENPPRTPPPLNSAYFRHLPLLYFGDKKMGKISAGDGAAVRPMKRSRGRDS